MIKKLFYKFFVCKKQGHDFINVQQVGWPDYYKIICKDCCYTDNIQYFSPLKIEEKTKDGKIEITISGGVGGGSGGSKVTG